MKSLKRLLIATSLISLIFSTLLVLADSPQEAQTLAGRWLVDAGGMDGSSRLSFVWNSEITVTGDSFAISKFWDSPKNLTGKFVLQPDKNAQAIDLTFDKFDMSELGLSVEYPACTLPGIYKLEPNRLTLCFQTGSEPQRPTEFRSTDRKTVLLTLVRADADFKQFPKEVTVTVVDSGDKPVAGASVFHLMSLWRDRDKESKPEWKYWEIGKTGADGTVQVHYEDLRDRLAAARDADHKLTGFTIVSPASLQTGAVKVVLQPECHLSGTMVCDEFKKLGKPIEWTNVHLRHAGIRIGTCSDPGKFEFQVPPGTYTLDAYGTNLLHKNVEVTVPTGQSELQVPPIALAASRLVMLEGRPAPELNPVLGWKGQPVKLADLRGKYVLLDFWGYWCGPCVADMPVLIELHEKFGDKGLAIVGVHVDMGGEIDTAEKLDEKIATYKKKRWQGKDLPFASALTLGKPDRGGNGGTVAEQYGVQGYPTTILIDREGKVVGLFEAHDAKEAVAKVEKLLGLQTSEAD